MQSLREKIVKNLQKFSAWLAYQINISHNKI